MRARFDRAAAALLLLVLLHACRADAPTGASPGGPSAPVTVRAALAGTAIQALTILVTGPAIPVPIVANIDVATDVTTASTTMSVPVGGQRTFVARGFDATGVLTHEGIATVIVRPTGNAPVAIRMYPKSGEVPITVGVGTFAIAIAPAPLAPMAPQETRPLVATVTDASTGAAVPNAVVAWGSLNPVVANVSPAGLVTARLPGATTLYATYEGTAASVDLVVTAAAPLEGYRDISAGPFFTCAVLESGIAHCWGANDFGQLGDGTTTDRPGPAPVAGGLRFASVAAGFGWACGVTLTAEGWCWGFNGQGNLGDGTTDHSPVPRRVAGGHAWRSISPGIGSTCGITTSGAAHCWGLGSPGGIGMVSDDGASYAVVPTPVAVTTAGGPWSRLSVAFQAACGIGPGGVATCSARTASLVSTTSLAGAAWQALELNQLSFAPPPAANPYADEHGAWACGLTTSGDARCVGESAYGALGGGAGVTLRSVATAVAGAQGWDAITVGGDFACAVRDGLASCWGRNDYGQLGDGTRTGRFTPTLVDTPQAFMRISAGFTHACALGPDGMAYCWGANTRGEIGDGTTTVRVRPVLMGVMPGGTSP